MALEHPPALLSYADFLRLPPESPGEVIDGELIVGPAPLVPHQRVVGTIYQAIANFLDAAPALGEVFIAPLDVVLRAERPATVLQPDVLFISAAREDIIRGGVHGAPDLAVEVVSPGSARTDGVVKCALYAAHGVREYWLVWPEEARIDVFVPGEGGSYGPPRELGGGDRLETPLLPGFSLEVSRVFAGRRPGAS